MYLQSYIPSQYKDRSNYTDKMKFRVRGDTLGNEVMIFAIAQMTGKDAEIYINDQWE